MLHPFCKTVWQLLNQLNIVTVGLSNPIPEYINKMENTCPHKDLYMNVYSGQK